MATMMPKSLRIVRFLLHVVLCVKGFQPLEIRRGLFSRTKSTTLFSSSDSSSSSSTIQHKDVVIIGGGLAGLSAALYLNKLDPNRHITILDREPNTPSAKTNVASFAAAGMLAPQSERLPKGPLLDICMASRSMFSEFCDWVETLARHPEGSDWLWPSSSNSRPWSVGFVASGGFVAPAFAGDSVATWAPPDESSAIWLDETQIRELEPQLHPSVVGGWWFPEDASVDARKLTCSLRAACVSVGAQLLQGPGYEVTALDLLEGTCRGLRLQNGRYVHAKSVLVANGAWMRQLLPVPLEPHKGQSLSLRMPPNQPPLLKRVLFAQDSYIVPKDDGRVVVGATVEAGSFDANVTPAGLLHILSYALQLVPGLADLPIEETWSGLRPTTPDKGPILGKTPWDNLFVAGGYWRNGVLLAPKTGQLMAQLMTDPSGLNKKDTALLQAFAWDRFTAKGGGAALAANARYAASMHPIHSRKSGVGVAAAVGTELGSYSTARSAAEERAKDRLAMFGSDDHDSSDSLEEAFERAAQLGRQDATVFTMGNKDEEEEEMDDDDTGWKPQVLPPQSTAPSSSDNLLTPVYEGSADAYTVAGTAVEEVAQSADDLSSVYNTIRENQAKREIAIPEASADERPDPGFRIYQIDAETGESREVPPFTSPDDFQKMVDAERKDSKDDEVGSELSAVYNQIRRNKAEVQVELPTPPSEDERPDPGFRIYLVDEDGESHMVPPFTAPEEMQRRVAALKGKRIPDTSQPTKTTTDPEEEYNEKTFDGYQTIQQANSRATREEELEAMRKARLQNRLGQEEIDESKIGVQQGPLNS